MAAYFSKFLIIEYAKEENLTVTSFSWIHRVCVWVDGCAFILTQCSERFSLDIAVICLI